MLKVAIIGAGPVGCTLARLLLRSSVSSQLSITIFEKDKSRKSRTSLGGCLDLHPLTGLAAMREMGLWEEFQKKARYEGEEMHISDSNGFVYVHICDAPPILGFDARPEIDREDLMDVVLQGVLDLAPNCVQWDKGVHEVAPNGDMWTVQFTDGESHEFDLVIGADGAWSKVRKALTDATPRYSGICSFSGSVNKESAGDLWDNVSRMAGKGSHFAMSFGQAYFLQRLGDGTMKSSFDFKKGMDWFEDFKEKHQTDEALREALLKEAEAVNWAPAYHDWIRASTRLWAAPLWELPLDHQFEHRKGLTLVGDAAHLMTPFAGEGVNAGMRDSLDLFKAIENALNTGADVDEAIGSFEGTMFARMREFMFDTDQNKQGMFSREGPAGMISGMMGQVIEETIGLDVRRGWKSWVWAPGRTFVWIVCWIMGTYGALRRRVVEARSPSKRPASC